MNSVTGSLPSVTRDEDEQVQVFVGLRRHRVGAVGGSVRGARGRAQRRAHPRQSSAVFESPCERTAKQLNVLPGKPWRLS